jgi:excisionase family DNA binding protein
MASIQPNVTARSIPRLGLNPDEAATATGVSRTRIFEAIRDGTLTARKAGKATVIEIEELQRWVQSLPVRGRAPDSKEPHAA